MLKEKVNSKESQIPVCNILGVNLSAINMSWLLDFIDNNLKELSGKYICVANVHTTVMASENEEYRKIQNEAVLALPDGGPLSKVGRKRGFSEMQRTTGPDFMREIFKLSKENNYKHYFVGGTQETLDLMIENLEKEFSGINICGCFSPPFRDMTIDEDQELITQIKSAGPDFIWVGLGAPKQEIWMYSHKELFDGVMVGVGAGFDYFAGNIKRAPMWMQKSNLEWLYRLIQEPSRLFKRYLITNTKFIFNVIIRGK